MTGIWFRRSLAILITAAMVLTTLAVAMTVQSMDTETAVPDGVTTEYATVELQDKALAVYDGGLPGLAATRPGTGERADPASPAGRAYGLYLKDKHDPYRGFLANQVPAGQVAREYSLLFNGFSIKLNGAKLYDLARGPGVKSVTYETLYYPDMSVSPGLIGAPELWGVLGGNASAGAGIKVGIIDTGIDQRHPFLSDPSLTMPQGFPRGDTTYTTNKVIVARVFCDPTFGRRFTPKDYNGHGTHVSGTVAGVSGTTATFKGVTINGLSGVAPKAYLGNYNVFPSPTTGCAPHGGTPAHDIADAVEAAYLDGMDVVNMSLGGGPGASPITHGMPSDQLMNVVDAASQAGMVVAVAAGNSGPGMDTIESPGSAPGALTAGASTNPHYVGLPVEVTGPAPVPANLVGIGAAVGAFATPKATLEAPYAPISDPANVRGCNAIADDLAGKLALISRGICTFTTKVRNAQTAHAIGVIVYNNVAGDPVAMAQDGTTPVPTIPAVMVSRGDGANLGAFYKANGGATLSIGSTFQEFLTNNADILAGFSSRGPTFGRLLIKPDVTAPGVNILSSFMCSDKPGATCNRFEFLQGTSMATPHVAGSAALLRQEHPGWSPEQIKSALVTTGKQPVWDSATGRKATRVMESGGGRIDLAAASKVDTTIGPASYSFGYVPTNDPFSLTKTFSIKADQGATLTISAAFTFGAENLTASVDKPGMTVGKGGSVSFTLTVAGGANTKPGDYEGWVMLRGTEGDGSTISLHVPFWIRTDSSLNVNNAMLPLGALQLGDALLLAGTTTGVLLALVGAPLGRPNRRKN